MNQVKIEALEVRIFLLEREFNLTPVRDTKLIYLLQVELEIAYKEYVALTTKRKPIPSYADQ
jgi:hypothetical protein